MADEQSGAPERWLTAALLVRASDGDDDAQRELVVRASREPLAHWALEVVLELQIAAAERSGGLPLPAPAVEARLEDVVRSMIERSTRAPWSARPPAAPRRNEDGAHGRAGRVP